MTINAPNPTDENEHRCLRCDGLVAEIKRLNEVITHMRHHGELAPESFEDFLDWLPGALRDRTPPGDEYEDA